VVSGTPKQFADAAVRRGATSLQTTGRDILGADVVISYGLKTRVTRIPFTSPMRNVPIRSMRLDATQSDSSGSVMPSTLIKTRRIKLLLVRH